MPSRLIDGKVRAEAAAKGLDYDGANLLNVSASREKEKKNRHWILRLL